MSTALSSSSEEQLHDLRHKDVLLLDSVFAAFEQTNMFRGQHLKLDDIFSTASGKRYFRFEHMSIPYLAIVETWQAPDREYIVLRLPNKRFSYASAAGQAFYRRHGWVELNGTQAMDFCPRLCQAVQDKFTSVVFTYNETHNRIDIMLSPEHHGTGLVIAFEPGHPFTDLVRMPMPRR
ncbi:hypothetical protein HYH02_010956 [Chlamydomonas schloesseri]|uniref:Uncharacterized protein n=1 Tax=Chlamydomonas schloesseri TaxID=2026947 RepID=A0A835T767_9CHLO|nr:hypothetical protein HYH02_010956 [Chlamydomonas schloesseri]|eukprot:KAG2438257.1 hypothetical protein HYH02_010956 [Chlamydomonas schloesseri]